MIRQARCALAPWLLSAAALLVSAAPGVAQESPKPEQSSPAAAEGETEVSPIWAWLNFAILAGGLGYLIVKKGGPYFTSRSQSIRRGMAEAHEIRANAEARAVEVDRRLEGLEAEIESLRGRARKEQAAEAQRIRDVTAIDLNRIRDHAAREIDSAGKAARLELKRYAAQLAVDLAAQKIRRQVTPEVQAALVENFGRELERERTGEHPI